MMKILRNQAGFSMVEIILCLGGLVAIGGGYMFLNSQQGKYIKSMSDSMNASTIGAIVQDIMKDPNSCVASVHDSQPAPPTLSTPVELTKIVKANKSGTGWTTETFFVVGKTYSHLKLEKILLRPYSATEDQTQNSKLVLTFRTDNNGIITKKYEFFSNNVAQAMYPTYAFGCSGKPMMSMLGNLLTVNVGNIPCNPAGTGTYQKNVTCPGGTKPVSCGIKDLNNTSNEDVITCYLDMALQTCVFNHELSGNCDTIQGECYCL
jgi:hypothetical protein